MLASLVPQAAPPVVIRWQSGRKYILSGNKGRRSLRTRIGDQERLRYACKINGISRKSVTNIHTLADVHSLMRIKCSWKGKKNQNPAPLSHYHRPPRILLLFLLQFIQSCLQLRDVRVKTLWRCLQGVDVIRQHLVRHSVFPEDVIVYGRSGHGGSEEEAD